MKVDMNTLPRTIERGVNMNGLVGIPIALGIIFTFRVIVTMMSRKRRENIKSFSDISKLHHWEDMRMALFIGITIVILIVVFMVM